MSSAVSAPGKVLVAGGYLVLDRAYTGLVFGLDARIHIVVKDIATTSGVSLSEITVRSPQFDEPSWNYSYRLAENDGGIEVTQLRVDASQPVSRNPFVETTLRYVLSYISKTSKGNSLRPMAITILADNDYYTTPAALTSHERFHNFAKPLSNVSKTGLGSSAALVTALTAGLLNHCLENVSFEDNATRRTLHNLAQAAHCAAQGKVGSGFDVASAVFGSCLYRRFSPDLLSSVPEPGTQGFAGALQEVVEETAVHWDTEIRKNIVVVPKGLRLVMCDVSCGSQTPGMVKKVLAWRSANKESATTIWDQLHAANNTLAHELQTVATSGTTGYSSISDAFTTIRKHIVQMGSEADVPIEPPAQTRLIDACCKIKGVIGGTVPGAGGYDAIVLLIEDHQAIVDELNKLFKSWNFDGEASGGKVSMLGVREEMVGVKVEAAQQYATWLS